MHSRTDFDWLLGQWSVHEAAVPTPPTIEDGCASEDDDGQVGAPEGSQDVAVSVGESGSGGPAGGATAAGGAAGGQAGGAAAAGAAAGAGVVAGGAAGGPTGKGLTEARAYAGVVPTLDRFGEDSPVECPLCMGVVPITTLMPSYSSIICRGCEYSWLWDHRKQKLHQYALGNEEWSRLQEAKLASLDTNEANADDEAQDEEQFEEAVQSSTTGWHNDGSPAKKGAELYCDVPEDLDSLADFLMATPVGTLYYFRLPPCPLHPPPSTRPCLPTSCHN
jgi:hypothetical protein